MSTKLQTVIQALQTIAPLDLAESWDNVGLLVEPSKRRTITRILLTIDLTEEVMNEAIRQKISMIVAYHPLIFDPLSRLTTSDQSNAQQRIVIRAIESSIAIYSPHTALDAAQGGTTDWLCDGLGKGQRKLITPAELTHPNQAYKMVVFVPDTHADALRRALSDTGAGIIGNYDMCSFNVNGIGTFLGNDSTSPAVGKADQLEKANEVRLEMVCPKTALPQVITAINTHHPYEKPAWDIYKLEPKPSTHVGQGRVLLLNQPVTLSTLVRRVKKHLKLKYVRVAAPSSPQSNTTRIADIAVCPGAGGTLFKNTHQQAYFTGEMRHHDILAKVAQGSAVILTDHSNSERGYLPILKNRLHQMLPNKIAVNISQADSEPLRIV